MCLRIEFIYTVFVVYYLSHRTWASKTLTALSNTVVQQRKERTPLPATTATDNTATTSSNEKYTVKMLLIGKLLPLLV